MIQIVMSLAGNPPSSDGMIHLEYKKTFQDGANWARTFTLAECKAELEAVKKAKAENDERFMIERDEARAKLAMAVEGLEFYASEQGERPSSRRAREVLEKIEGKE